MLQATESVHSGAHAPQLERENPHATTREKPARCNKRSRVLQLRPDTAKNKEMEGGREGEGGGREGGREREREKEKERKKEKKERKEERKKDH